jgi:hypothetical protein
VLDDGIVEGLFRRSCLHGMGIQYSHQRDDYVLGVFDKNNLIGTIKSKLRE